MDALCDPSSPDVTGSVLEAFGILQSTSLANRTSGRSSISYHLSHRLSTASNRAIQYLANSQLANGSWYGRLGVNYVYGTSRVLWALWYFDEGDEQVHDMVQGGVYWLKSFQGSGGGWGEDVKSYANMTFAGRGYPTASQTSWALMAILTACRPDDKAVVARVEFLLASQNDIHSTGEGLVWKEERYTGIGFPEFFYIGYTSYRVCFPLMTLGRWVSYLNSGETYGSREATENRCTGTRQTDSTLDGLSKSISAPGIA